MERIDGIVGNVHADDELAARRVAHEEDGTLERVVIDAENRRRSRFRATTDAGTDVGVVVDTPAVSAGDVLLVADDRMIVVAFEPVDALAIALPDATAARLEAAVELGHRVGNQHWDLAVDDGTVYVPLEADRHIVERVVADVVPGSELRETTVEADLFVTALEDEEAGSDGGPGSEHGHGVADHIHGHDGSEHTHGHDGGEHAHEHGPDNIDPTHEHDHSHDH
ncbi:urease accessory protein UreE [Natrinema ejinorense]|uniref:Urease accessory protein UreE n=1 Tax=Natrinema ejinorense TaxID=373386 RepID=A0A2A5QTL0_9EURY|nr:urease accessory protein UreE [Natrinema ejinorense]PCR90099.1 urease accessory protein UreE [Natrinema ejinorense]